MKEEAFTFNMKETGKRISNLRRNRNMTQVELADHLNISYQAVSNWERGESMPDISKLPQLAHLFGVGIDDILSSGKQAGIIHEVMASRDLDSSQSVCASTQDLIDTMPLLKPDQLEPLLERIEGPFTLEELSGIAPFVSSEVLNRLAACVERADSIEELSDIAPFVSSEVLNRLAACVERVDSIEELSDIAPFLSRQVLDSLAAKACKNNSQ